MKKAQYAVQAELLKDLYTKILEIQKARLTGQLALFAAYLALTGIAFREKIEVTFLFAAIIPPIALATDLITKFKYMTPYLYKSSCFEHQKDPRQKNTEPLWQLIIEFGQGDDSKLQQILREPPGAHRQKQFRRFYTFQHILPKSLFYSAFISVQIILYCYMGIRW